MERFVVEVCKADTPTKSKKVYSRKLLEAQIELLKDVIKNRGWIGELDRPTDSIIHFVNASHLVTDLFFDGDSLMAEIELLNTPPGRVLKSVIDAGTKVDFCMAGVGGGIVNEDGNLIVGDSYKLIQIYADH